MSAPLTPEEIRRRQAVLAALPPKKARGRTPKAANVSLGTVNWPSLSEPPPPEYGPVLGQLPVEKHMLNEQAWISEHPLGEKA